jgi:hypothetical protein
MSSPARSRPVSLRLVLVLCAAALSARLLMAHTQHVEAPAPAAIVQSPFELPDSLPPLW